MMTADLDLRDALLFQKVPRRKKNKTRQEGWCHPRWDKNRSSTGTGPIREKAPQRKRGKGGSRFSCSAHHRAWKKR